MKTMILTALIVCSSFDVARAGTNAALDCLRASANGGGLSACLNESGDDAAAAVSAGGAASRTAAAPALSAAAPSAGEKSRSTVVPTPTGYTSAEEGTLKAGFYNGLDSGFKTAFMAIEYLPVLGIEASGAPYQSNAGTVAFTALGMLLAIPASVIAVALGAPLGAAAGMIAEKVSPGSTNGWFTF